MEKTLARLAELRPWEHINEEDLFRVGGLYLSVRGNVRSPEGIWCTRSQTHASRWISNPSQDPDDSDWAYDAGSGKMLKCGLPDQDVLAAVEQVLNQFEGLPFQDLEFPVWLNPA